MRLLVNRLLVGLLVSGWLSVDFGRGTAKLALELILAFLNSPRLWPIPRASSGSFFAPNSSTTTTRMKRVSGPPGILRAIGRFTEAPYSGFLALQSADPTERPWTEECSSIPGSQAFHGEANA